MAGSLSRTLAAAHTYRVRFRDHRHGGKAQSAIVVAFYRRQAIDIFRLVTKRPPDQVDVEHVELVAPTLPSFRDNGPFIRLDHRALDFPVPGFWLPAGDCGGHQGLKRMGFERFGDRDPGQPLPESPSITALFPNPNEISLMLRDPRNPVRALKQPLLETVFADNHPSWWLEDAFATGRLALLTTLVPFTSFDTIGAAIPASWVLLASVPDVGHGVPEAARAAAAHRGEETGTSGRTDRPRASSAELGRDEQIREASRRAGLSLSELVSERATDQPPTGRIATSPSLIDLPEEREITHCLLGANKMPALVVQLPGNTAGLLAELEAAGLRRIRGLDRTLPVAPTGWGYILWPHQVLIMAGYRSEGGFIKLLFDPLVSPDDWLAHVPAAGRGGLALLITCGTSTGPTEPSQVEQQMSEGMVVGAALIGWLA